MSFLETLSPLLFSASQLLPGAVSPRPSFSDGIACWLFDQDHPSASLELQLPPFSSGVCGLKIELQLHGFSADFPAAAVFSSSLTQAGKTFDSAPAMVFAGQNDSVRTVTLESCVLIDPAQSSILTIGRRTCDPEDSFAGSCAVTGVTVSPLLTPDPPSLLADSPGYNSWPMCQAMRDRIVCTYSRGKAHDICEPERAVYARISLDGGNSWEEETLVCNTPGRGDVTIGKGLDSSGNMLLWVRHTGDDGCRHRLYRSADGRDFEVIFEADLPLNVIQITDIFHVPGIGLMALYFGGDYHTNTLKFWGKLVSSDDGLSWQNTLIEDELPVTQWPTEPSAVYLGDGRILVIARTEVGEDSCRRAQFQITSTDYGRTWHKFRTNITDVKISTPSLIYDPETQIVYCYYFHRGKGVLKCRTAPVKDVFDSPMSWPEPENIAIGSCEVCEAGNVNAACFNPEYHILSWYSGAMPDTAVCLKKVRVC